MSAWYVRKSGSDSNGGTSAGLTPERSGTDMAVTNASTQVTSASAVFVAGDAGKGINIAGVLYVIATYTNATTVQLDHNYAGTTGSSKAWAIGGALLTINKVTNVGSVTVVAGDTCYIGAGVYREVLVFGQTYSGSAVTLIGDVDGSHTGDAGEVQVTGYTTNDKTAPNSSVLVNIAGTNFWAFKNIVFVGGTGNPKLVSTGNAANITFTDCVFIGLTGPNTNAFTMTFGTASARNVTFDRCRLISTNGIAMTLPMHASADYDANVKFQNCIIDVGSTAVDITASGALTGKGGGVYFYNCLIRGASNPIFRTNSANISTTIPVKVENCILIAGAGSTFLSANTSGQIVESYNIICATTPRASVTAGTGSVSDNSYAMLVSIGQELMAGAALRPQYMPTAGSPLLGLGSSGNGPTVDILGAARPAGSGGSASYTCGPYERGNTWGKETTTVHTASNALSITGPGYVDFLLPVDAVSTTVSVYLRYDSNYAGTRPTMKVLNGGECGVADASVTVSTGGLNLWSQVSLTFTPTAKGVVTIRLVSSDSSGNSGKAFADSFAVT